MNLTVYPYQPFEIYNHEINILGTDNPGFYEELMHLVLTKDDRLRFSNEFFQNIETGKVYNFMGDLLIDVDLNHLFLNKIYTTLEQQLDDTQRIHIDDMSRKLVSAVQSLGYDMDVDLDINSTFQLPKLMKLCNLRINDSTIQTSLAKLETLVKIEIELGNTKLIVFNNLLSYLKISELLDVNEWMKSTNQTILDLEFMNLDYIKSTGVNFKYIDYDFCEW